MTKKEKPKLPTVTRESDKVIVDCAGNEVLADQIRENIEKGFKNPLFKRAMKGRLK